LDVAKAGVPADAVGFLETIAGTLTNDVLPTLVDETSEQKDAHDAVFAGFAAARSWYDSITIDDAPTNNAKATHTTCRQQEKGDYDRTVTCSNQEAADLGTFNGKQGAVRAASQASGACVDSDYDWRTSEHLTSYQANVGAYKNAIDEVIGARTTLEAKIAECDGLDGVLAAKVGVCNGDQTAYENAACAYALAIQAEAANYTSSYNAVESEFSGAKAGWEAQFVNREHQCKTVKTLICYVQALIDNDAQGALSGAIAACDGDTYDCSEMRFAVSDVPAAGSTTDVPAAPCADGFDYGVMPEGTQTGDCSACIGIQ